MRKVLFALLLLLSSCVQEDFLDKKEGHEVSSSSKSPQQATELLYKQQIDHYSILSSFIVLDKQTNLYTMSLTSEEALELGIGQEKYQEFLDLISRINQHIK